MSSVAEKAYPGWAPSMALALLHLGRESSGLVLGPEFTPPAIPTTVPTPTPRAQGHLPSAGNLQTLLPLQEKPLRGLTGLGLDNNF